MNTALNLHASIALAGIMCLGVQSSALAHPAAGIVVTDDGAIYFAYAPGSAIWNVTPDSKAEPFVTGKLDQESRVPHSLYLDKDGNLITVSDAGSFIWRISVNGEKTKIFPPGGRLELLPVAAGGDPFAITPDDRIIATLDGTLETGRPTKQHSIHPSASPTPTTAHSTSSKSTSAPKANAPAFAASARSGRSRPLSRFQQTNSAAKPTPCGPSVARRRSSMERSKCHVPPKHDWDLHETHLDAQLKHGCVRTE